MILLTNPLIAFLLCSPLFSEKLSLDKAAFMFVAYLAATFMVQFPEETSGISVLGVTAAVVAAGCIGLSTLQLNQLKEVSYLAAPFYASLLALLCSSILVWF